MSLLNQAHVEKSRFFGFLIVTITNYLLKISATKKIPRKINLLNFF